MIQITNDYGLTELQIVQNPAMCIIQTSVNLHVFVI